MEGAFSKRIQAISNAAVKKYERALKALEVMNSGNYSHKLESLKSKLTDEYKLWTLKKHSHPNRFYDVDRDVNTLRPMYSKPDLSATEKATIDRLCTKYNVK